MTTMQERTWRAGRFWWGSSAPDDHPLRAMIFDLDALTDVECGGHRLAFNAAFVAHGLPLRWSPSRYRKLLALSDERQRVAAELRARGICTESDVLARLLVEEICATKSLVVDEVMLDADLVPRPGVVDLITDAFTAGVSVGVVSSGRRQWVQPLVRQLCGDGLVHTIVTADDVVASRSRRDGYRTAMAELGFDARETLTFTGSRAGVKAASEEGLAGVLVDPGLVGALADYDGLLVADCQRMQARLCAGGSAAA